MSWNENETNLHSYRHIIGYVCPECGNEISYEDSNGGEAILCMRCPSGEYTTMEEVYEEE